MGSEFIAIDIVKGPHIGSRRRSSATIGARAASAPRARVASLGLGELGITGALAETFVARLMRSNVATGLISLAPVPLCIVRSILIRDDARENRKDSWQRLRGPDEAARYRAVRNVVERYARDGLVLDIGCSQGILQEGLVYGRYLGVDSCEQPIAIAQAKSDQRTQFVWADGSEFVADQPPDVVVMSEVIYYLASPIAAARHHARQLAPGGVLIISTYARTWATRRLLRTLATQLELVEINLVRSGHLAWTVAVFQPLSGEVAATPATGMPGVRRRRTERDVLPERLG
jgi:SAM-dependent methyltransferase